MGLEEIAQGRFDATRRTPLDGGIPLTFSLALLLFSIGFMFLLIARPRLPRFFYPRIWSPGYAAAFPPPAQRGHRPCSYHCFCSSADKNAASAMAESC